MGSSDKSSVTVHSLRCEYLTNPIGTGEPRPRLSWKLAAAAGHENARGLKQSAYRILVASDPAKLAANQGDLWDSGEVRSNQTVFIPYAGKVLNSGERAWWTVRALDQDGNSSTPTQPAFWEAGLLRRDEWKGKWIGSQIVGGQHAEAPVPLVRKSFSLPTNKRITSARLYATALGLYEFSLNGEKVGDDVFNPLWTDYRKRVQYQAYDVTNMLTSGENVAGAFLGDGWYCGYTGNIGRRQFYGDRPKLLAQLVIQFDDGSKQIIATDESWMTAASPIVSADFMMGERYDARLEMPGWDKPGFDPDRRWTPVVLFDDPGIEINAMIGPTVRAVKEIQPTVKKLALSWGRENSIADFGQNMVGRVRIRVKGPAGSTIRLQFVEVLDANGHPYKTNLRSAQQRDTYTLRGDPNGETYDTRFTFHGFRYAQIDSGDMPIALESITGIVLHSDMAEIGTFECSEPLVNQLQSNIQWGQRGNFVDVPTDCPQRDERLGWTGDAQVFVRTAAFNFDVAGFFAKWTQDLRDAQGQLGSYPHVAPNNGTVRIKDGIEHDADGGPAWADAGLICPWTMYLCNGDLRLIETHYASMVRFVEHLREVASRFDMIRSHPRWNGFAGYGDWLSTDGKDVFGGTPKDLIGTAFLAYDARLLSQMAIALNRTDDAARYAKLADEVTAAFCRRFVTGDGLIVGNTQTAIVLALHFDLLPKNLRPAAMESLIQRIDANGKKLTTGFVGSPYLNHVLTAGDRLDVAYGLLMQKNWPSWLYAVTQGATTIWERWDGWTHDKGFQDAGMNSFNHYAYGAIGAWLYQVVAGIEIDPLKPGYEHIIIHPRPIAGGPLTHAKAAIETIRGRVESSWRIDADGKTCHYEMLVPPNTTATITLPATDSAKVLESGKTVQNRADIRVLQSGDGVPSFEVGAGRYSWTSMLSQSADVA